MLDTTELVVRELGRERVITANDDAFLDYCRDESHLRGEPDVVVCAESQAHVSAVLRLAAEHAIFVTPRGAGSGKVGGCVATRGGIVLSTERMQRILELDPNDGIAIVEPGVVTATLAAEADGAGLYYPPDPASLEVSSLGGNIATNAGGPSALKYGVTGRYVLGLDVAVIGGEHMSIGRRAAKGVSGLDLVSAFVGSEGTLAALTRATLALIPKPPERATLLATFESLSAAAEAAFATLRAGVWPCTLELVDETTYHAMREACSRAMPDRAGAALLIELDGHGCDRAVASCAATMERAGVSELVAARDAAEARALWRARRGISRALKARYPHKISEDICVPRGKIAVAVARIGQLSRDSGIEIATYGHVGDGNLHVNFLIDAEPSAELAQRLERSIERLFELAIELGGTLSGEHGIGTAKRRFMSLEHGAQSLLWQHRIKAMWDPRGLLNPDKVLPASRQP